MADPVSITFLGGLGDIGRNCAAIETQGKLLLLDCGQLFPDDTMPGANSVLPDFSYLADKGDRIVGCITTHGHEDHIGALAHVLRDHSFPIYGSPFTLGMVRSRLEEAGVLGKAKLRPVADNSTLSIGPFDCEFLPVTHSVPSGLITVISTPQGKILHSSDFKLDPTPIDGRLTDMARIEALAADPGIRLLLCDSTNADVPGATASESEIGPAFEKVFTDHDDRRIITACFSSHVHRVQQIIDVALKHDRKVATLGMSMNRNITLARELGLLKVPDTHIIDMEDVRNYPPHEVCVLSTGSQAESRSALALASYGDSHWIQIDEHDTVVMSSFAIPGNEGRVARMIDELVRRGAKVLHASQLGLHTSGHGKQDELRALHEAASPEFFVPVHGEFHHMVAHAELAEQIGMAPEKVFLAQDGDQVVLTDDGMRLNEEVTPGGYTFVQGRLTEDDHEIFREREILGTEGFVLAAVTVDPDSRSIVGAAQIVSKGWLGEDNYGRLCADAAADLTKAVEKLLRSNDDITEALLERKMRRSVGGFVNARTGRRPMIVPMATLLTD